MSHLKPPPKNYKCHKCQTIGKHWIMNCPKNEHKATTNSTNSKADSPIQSPKIINSDQITLYWDYESMPIDKSTNLIGLLSTIKNELLGNIGYKLPIQILVYVNISKLTQHIQNAFDINGIIQIPVPDSVSKRMIVDVLLCLYELQRDNKTRAFGLITSDVDFVHLFSKIQPTAPVSNLCLILLRNIDSNDERSLSKNVHKVIKLNCSDFIGDNNNDNVSIDLNVNKIKKIKNKVKRKGKSKKKRKFKKPKRGKIRIKITNTDNYKSEKIMTVTVAKDIKINKLKKKIRRKYISGEYSDSNLILRFQNDAMLNKETLSKFNVKNGDTLTWYWWRESKTITLKFKQLHTKNTFWSHKFQKQTQIQHLRREVHRRNGHLKVPIHAFKLFYKLIELMDYTGLDDYCNSSPATIIWRIEDSTMSQHDSSSHCNQAIEYAPVNNENVGIQYNDVQYNGCTYYSQNTKNYVCWDYLSGKECPRKFCRWLHIDDSSHVDLAAVTGININNHRQINMENVGVEMQDEKTGNETVVNAVISTSNDIIQITIRATDESVLFSCFKSEFLRNATIKSVEDKIRDIDRTLLNSTEEMFLTFKGDKLNKDETFEHYGIDNGDTLVWYSNGRKTGEIAIQISDIYGSSVMLKVKQTLIVNELKQILAMNYPTWYIRNVEHGWFRFEGKRLNILWSLTQCGISDGDKLEWLCQYN